jgi:hypothetical protein
MESEPTHTLEELSNILTLIRMDNEDLFFDIEKLVEVIQLELRFNVLPELAIGCQTDLEWSDGHNHILISIHVEEEGRNSYSIKLTNSTD